MTAPRKLLALQLPPGPAFLEAWRAAWAEGHAVLPLPADLSAPERDRLLARLRPHELWHDAGREELDGVELDPRTDLVVTTSGSTGEPKGVQLCRGAVEASARASLARLGAGGEDAWLCCLPLQHMAGLQVVVRAELAGAPLRLHERFDPARVATEPDVAFVSLVPTMLARLLDDGVDVARFRAILLGGSAASDGLLARARAAGARVVTTYGMSETAGGCVYDGVPLDDVELRLDAEGRIALRGPMLFHGYRLDPARTAEAFTDAGFLTADRGVIEDGRLRVLGRVDEVIVSGGENVSLVEVAELLTLHDGVADAATFGLADERWGQMLVAAVVPVSPDAPPSLEELRAHVRRLASAHKAPRALLLLDALPMTALGKVNRSALVRLADRKGTQGITAPR